jgi:hypothetical protein
VFTGVACDGLLREQPTQPWHPACTHERTDGLQAGRVKATRHAVRMMMHQIIWPSEVRNNTRQQETAVGHQECGLCCGVCRWCAGVQGARSCGTSPGCDNSREMQEFSLGQGDSCRGALKFRSEALAEPSLPPFRQKIVTYRLLWAYQPRDPFRLIVVADKESAAPCAASGGPGPRRSR